MNGDEGCAIIVFFGLLILLCVFVHRITVWDYRESMVKQGVAHYEVDARTGSTKFVYTVKK